MAPLRQRGIWLAVSSALCVSAPAQAQITTDGTLGAVQAFTGLNSTIPASLGKQTGGNLFHSFSAFNVPTAGSAIFAGPGPGSPQVSNVISRVTGGQFSSIDGRLGSSIPGANLFLINPRGILFGPNASLDLTGSFFASTANYVKLADGTRFEATATVNPILTAAPPEAFGFLGPTGTITVDRSSFDLAAGRGLGLVGGAIDVRSALLRTRAADIRLESVTTGEGGVSATAAAAGTAYGNVTINASQVRAINAGTAAPGRIVIRGGELLVTGDTIVRSQNGGAADAAPVELTASGNLHLSTGRVFANTEGAGRGADVRLAGDNVTIERTSSVQSWSASIPGTSGRAGDIDVSARRALSVVSTFADAGYTTFYNVAFGPGSGGATRLSGDTVAVRQSLLENYTQSSGNAGPLEIHGRIVSVDTGSYVANSARDGTTGRGGSIGIAATERAFVGGRDADGYPTTIETYTAGANRAGAIDISAPLVDVAGARVMSYGFGTGSRAGGDITIAGGSVDVRGQSQIIVETSGADRAGDLRFIAQGLRFADASDVENVAYGTGRGGDLELRATGKIALESGAFVQALTLGAGRAGDFVVGASELALTGGTFLQNQARRGTGNAGALRIDADVAVVDGGSTINGRTFAASSGRGADLTLNVGELRLANGGFVNTNTEGSGHGGDLTISARGAVTADASYITSLAFAGGDAGRIRIDADRVALANGSKINGAAQAGSSGRAADIDLRVGELSFTGTTFIDSGALGLGQAGNLSIAASRAVLMDGGSIGATTYSALPGGRITVRSPLLRVAHAAIVSSTLGDGAGGDLDIEANRIVLERAGQLIASSGQFENGVLVPARGNAGRISVRASEELAISGFNSGIFSTAFDAGASGSIQIATPRLIATDRASISASTGGSGNAGSIAIDVGDLGLSGGAVVASVNVINLEGRGPVVGTGASGSVRVAATGDVALSGADTGIFATTQSGGAGGTVSVSARDLTLSDGAEIGANTGGAGNAGKVSLAVRDLTVTGPSGIASANRTLLGGGRIGTGNAGDVDIAATGSITFSGDGFVSSQTYSSGNGGRVTIASPSLAIRDRAYISAGTLSSGTGGAITIDAGRVALAGGVTTAITAATEGSGRAGGIVIHAAEAVESEGRQVIATTSGSGDGGTISVHTPLLRLADGGALIARTFGTGRAGAVDVDVDRLVLERGGAIVSSSGGSSAATGILTAEGDAGGVNVVARQGVEISGTGPRGDSGLYANTFGPGAGGRITVRTPSLALWNQGVIQANTFGAGRAGDIDVAAGALSMQAAGIQSVSMPNPTLPANAPRGGGGSIRIAADAMVLDDDAGITTVTNTSAPAGTVDIRTGRLDLLGGAFVSSRSHGTGNAGNVNIVAGDALRIFGGSSILTGGTLADGGNIDLRVGNLLHLRDSEISTAVGSGQGAGGNIFIDPTFVILENSRIVANAFGGPGGNIRIFATYFLNTLDSLVDASSQAGVPGTVQISSPNSNLSTQIKVLPATFFDASALVREACSSRYASGERGAAWWAWDAGALQRRPNDSPRARTSRPNRRAYRADRRRPGCALSPHDGHGSGMTAPAENRRRNAKGEN